MICPVCHTEIADGISTCPACHTNLDATRVMPKLTGTYCSSCGSLVPQGSKTCPHCGISIASGDSLAARKELEHRNFEVGATPHVKTEAQQVVVSSGVVGADGKLHSNDMSARLPRIDEDTARMMASAPSSLSGEVDTNATTVMPRIAEPLQGGAAQGDAQTTRTMPRMESAIPAEPTPESDEAYGKSALQRTRVFAIAAIASLVIVGGAVLLVTHPWNPLQNYQRATTAADVSTAGYPGEVSHLSGQDKSGAEALSVISADEQAYSDLSSAYDELNAISEKADALEALLDSKATSGSQEERDAGYTEAQQLSLDISNLASKISGIDVATTGTYTQDRDNMATLASWLRNRIEAIESSWKLSSESSDPASEASTILAPMLGNRTTDGSEAYVNLFSSNYKNWQPQEK